MTPTRSEYTHLGCAIVADHQATHGRYTARIEGTGWWGAVSGRTPEEAAREAAALSDERGSRGRGVSGV